MRLWILITVLTFSVIGGGSLSAEGSSVSISRTTDHQFTQKQRDEREIMLLVLAEESVHEAATHVGAQPGSSIRDLDKAMMDRLVRKAPGVRAASSLIQKNRTGSFILVAIGTIEWSKRGLATVDCYYFSSGGAYSAHKYSAKKKRGKFAITQTMNSCGPWTKLSVEGQTLLSHWATSKPSIRKNQP